MSEERPSDAKLVSVPKYKDIQRRWAGVIANGGWGTQYLTNHDSPRQISRFGNDAEFRVESGKMLAMLTRTQAGTVFIYQSEEIGMTNVYFTSIKDYGERYTVGKYNSMMELGIFILFFDKKGKTLHISHSNSDRSMSPPAGKC